MLRLSLPGAASDDCGLETERRVRAPPARALRPPSSGPWLQPPDHEQRDRGYIPLAGRGSEACEAASRRLLPSHRLRGACRGTARNRKGEESLGRRCGPRRQDGTYERKRERSVAVSWELAYSDGARMAR